MAARQGSRGNRRDLLPVALHGCGKPTHARPAARPAASTPAATPSPTPSAGSNVRACFDGDCLLKVAKPVRVLLDAKRFHYPYLAVVAVTSARISYRVDYPGGGHAEQWLAVGGSSSFSFRTSTPVEVRLVPIAEGKAVLGISPG